MIYERMEEYDMCRRKRLRDVIKFLEVIFETYTFNLIGITGAEKIARWFDLYAVGRFVDSPFFQALNLTDPVEICEKIGTKEFRDKALEVDPLIPPDFTIEVIDFATYIIRGGPRTYLIYVDDPLHCIIACESMKCARIEKGEFKPLEPERIYKRFEYKRETYYYILGCNQPVLYIDESNPKRWEVMWI